MSRIVHDFVLVWLGKFFCSAFSFPGDSWGFDHDFIFKIGYFSVWIWEIEPCNVVFIEYFEPKDIFSCDGETLMYVLESNIIFLDVDSENIRNLRIVFIFGNVIIDESHLFFHVWGFIILKRIFIFPRVIGY